VVDKLGRFPSHWASTSVEVNDLGVTLSIDGEVGKGEVDVNESFFVNIA
jgi:hypothetical protein